MKRHKQTCMYSVTRTGMKRRGSKFNPGRNYNRTSVENFAVRHGEGTTVPLVPNNSDGVCSNSIVEDVDHFISDDGSCNITDVRNCIEPDTQQLKHDKITMAGKIISFIERIGPKHAPMFFSLLCDDSFDMKMLRTEIST